MDNLSLGIGFILGIGFTLIVSGFHKDWEKPKQEFKILKNQEEIDQDLLDRSIRGEQTK